MMFTGIVEQTGIVQDLKVKTNLSVLTVQAAKLSRSVRVGQSIAVNGVCLTVTRVVGRVLRFDLMRETLACTNLGDVCPGDAVNLERALKANGRIDGHFVSGHVDAIVRLKDIIERENYTEFRLSLNKALRPYLVPKGSVCLDGISLTVGEVKERYFSVYLIPLTKQVTTFGQKRKGARVNIETDLLAKYVRQAGLCRDWSVWGKRGSV